MKDLSVPIVIGIELEISDLFHLYAGSTFHPGNVIGLIGFAGFSPASVCHDLISFSDHVPEELVMAK